jgi:hypothetical protein
MLWKSKLGGGLVFVFDTLSYWNMLCTDKMFNMKLYCKKIQNALSRK